MHMNLNFRRKQCSIWGGLQASAVRRYLLCKGTGKIFFASMVTAKSGLRENLPCALFSATYVRRCFCISLEKKNTVFASASIHYLLIVSILMGCPRSLSFQFRQRAQRLVVELRQPSSGGAHFPRKFYVSPTSRTPVRSEAAARTRLLPTSSATSPLSRAFWLVSNSLLPGSQVIGFDSPGDTPAQISLGRKIFPSSAQFFPHPR